MLSKLLKKSIRWNPQSFISAHSCIMYVLHEAWGLLAGSHTSQMYFSTERGQTVPSEWKHTHTCPDRETKHTAQRHAVSVIYFMSVNDPRVVINSATELSLKGFMRLKTRKSDVCTVCWTSRSTVVQYSNVLLCLMESVVLCVIITHEPCQIVT